jgi:hypothetical protein
MPRLVNNDVPKTKKKSVPANEHEMSENSDKTKSSETEEKSDVPTEQEQEDYIVED